jgi:zinc and cadmium transporter
MLRYVAMNIPGTAAIEAFWSVFFVSAASLAGIAALFTTKKSLKGFTFAMVSLSAGVLFGDVLLHIFPDIYRSALGFVSIAALVFCGLLAFFVMEKYLHWEHEHGFHEYGKEHVEHLKNQALGPTVLTADSLHNFLDGLIVGASYLAGAKIGLATTLAVVFHEIPHEIGNVGVLLHAGYSKRKAFYYNMFTALTAFLGLGAALFFGGVSKQFSDAALAVAAGGFIYIAGSELVPELHQESRIKQSVFQFICMVAGFALMVAVLALE